MTRTHLHFHPVRLLALATIAAPVCIGAFAQSTTAMPKVTDTAATAIAAAPTGDIESNHPSLLDNTMSANGDLLEGDLPQSGHLRLPTMMDPWFAWKRAFQQDTGLSIGGSYQLLGQNYSSSLINQNKAVGSKLTINFSYALLNAGRPDALAFDMAVEDRRPFGNDLAPLHAGLSTGSMVPTAATYGEFDLGISQAYIRQNLFDNQFQYTVGKIFAPNFIDAYPFFDETGNS